MRGDRYGWVPRGPDVPADLAGEWPVGCSLQHAEIQAALAHGGGMSRGVVMYRRGIEEGGEGVSGEAKGWRSRLANEEVEMSREGGVAVVRYTASGAEPGAQETMMKLEEVGEFEERARTELDRAIAEWCAENDMPWSLSETSRLEAEAEEEAVGGPVTNIARKGGRGGAPKKVVTVPTFRQTVAWRCHSAAAEASSRGFVERNGSLEAVFRTVREGRQTTVLVGEPGSGKTSLLGRVSRRFEDLKEGHWLVLNHFAGAVRSSARVPCTPT